MADQVRYHKPVADALMVICLALAISYTTLSVATTSEQRHWWSLWIKESRVHRSRMFHETAVYRGIKAHATATSQVIKHF